MGMNLQDIKLFHDDMITHLNDTYGEIESKEMRLLTCSNKLMEETGELASMINFWRKRKSDEKGSYSKEKAGDEIADIIFVLYSFCEELDIDVEEALARKMKKNGEKMGF